MNSDPKPGLVGVARHCVRSWRTGGGAVVELRGDLDWRDCLAAGSILAELRGDSRVKRLLVVLDDVTVGRGLNVLGQQLLAANRCPDHSLITWANTARGITAWLLATGNLAIAARGTVIEVIEETIFHIEALRPGSDLIGTLGRHVYPEEAEARGLIHGIGPRDFTERFTTEC